MEPGHKAWQNGATQSPPIANLHLAKTIGLTAERRRILAAQRRAIQENEAIKTLLKNQNEVTLTANHEK